MKKVSRSALGMWVGSIALLAAWADPTHAQPFGSAGSGMSFGTMSSSSFPGIGSYFSGSPAYIPFGGAMGGFVPYRSGPGGGLGVLPGMRGAGRSMPSGAMGMPGSRPSLGLIRGEITPLAPIGLGIIGSRAGGGMGSMGGLIRRSPTRGAMDGMPRPPVGSYPFRQPPSLLGPAPAAPAMSM
jgi:hypothetical protein